MAQPLDPPDLSVLIVSYQTRALTLDAVAAALAQTGPTVEVIVVDNASTDGSARAIADRFAGVTLLAQTRNLGFARACNLAAGRARGDYLLLLNPDTRACPGTFAALMDFARRHPQAGIWGGRTLDPQGRLDPRSCAGRPSLWSILAQAAGLATLWPQSRLFNPEALPGWARDTPRQVAVVIGCFLLIRRDFWQALGGFDPAYFMYGEDVDLCLRAARAGARPAITPEATIVHAAGASQPAAPREIQVLAGRIRTVRRHLPRWQQGLAVWAIRLGVGLRLGCYRAASLFPQARPHRDRQRQVWARRAEWWHGYPDLPP